MKKKLLYFYACTIGLRSVGRVLIGDFRALLFITSRVSDGCNSFGFLCVCDYVCLSILLSQPNGQMCRLEFWHVGQVEKYLGQARRSRSQVNDQGHQVKKCFSYEISAEKCGGSLEVTDADDTCLSAADSGTNGSSDHVSRITPYALS